AAAFQFWCPGVYSDYQERLSTLFRRRPDLERIFPRSIFPTAAFNFGPRVCTYKHRDVLNCPYGWCGIHPLGHFDHTRGGHVLLWEAGLMIECPANWWMGIPSGSITHGNSPVGAHETRVSFTQYCPGGLLRYVENGLRTESEFAEEDPAGFQAMLAGKETRWMEKLALLSNYNDILSELATGALM
ncbi:hypothetical protein HYPSUDRAFT_152244, partial [Hypholoma sublateritium FD-334 SS-4]